jgi:acyl-CoA synthetase (AMP-forming)/AMP-acid ligase II
MGRSGEIVTYGELETRSNQLARLWRSAGIREGDHVAVFLENHPHYLEVVWAGLRSGLYVTAINSFLTAPEVAYILNDCGALALVTSRTKQEIVAQLEAENATPLLRSRLMMDGASCGFESYEEATASESRERMERETLGTTMLYSSGTTGRPKGIKRALTGVHPSEFENPRPLGPIYNYNENMVYLSPAPMYHAAPLAFVNATLGWGGSVVMMEKFDPGQSLSLIEKYKVTHSQWVPTMFSRMLKLPEAERTAFDLSSHECAIHAAAPCPVPVKREMIEWWGPILYEYYAGTEGNGSTGIDSHEWLEKPGSVGRASEGRQMRILDPDGVELAPGEIGDVYFLPPGGPGSTYHYLGAEPRRTPDGWETLGDMGRIDEDGYLFLVDRRTDLIISGGANIYPAEVEGAIEAHPDVRSCAVIGLPDEDLGATVHAIVQTVAPVEEAALRSFLSDLLVRYKIPRTFEFVDQPLKDDAGKMRRRALREARISG